MPPFNANHIACFRLIRGGLAVANLQLREPGTIGFIGTTDGSDRWLVSCYHVLCRPQGTPMPPGVRESIMYAFDAGQSPRVLAHVEATHADDVVDCAAARIIDPLEAVGNILGIGIIDPRPIKAEKRMRVLKSGIATGVTEGVVSAIGVGGKSTIHIETVDPKYALCSPGDSGALWIDAKTLRPVALHTGGRPDDERSVAVATDIEEVLQRIGLRVVVDGP